eukprot:jgi/Psemu1/321427/estExt_fgenesh1_pg.C_20041
MAGTSSNSESNGKKADDAGGILLSLPRCDVERPDIAVGRGGSGMGKSVGVGGNQTKKSMKTTAKRPDLVLFQLPKTNTKKGSEKTNTIRDDLFRGRCQIMASAQSASLVTPSTSLQLVTVGTSNALVVWKKEEDDDDDDESGRSGAGDESPMKRRKIINTATATTTTTTTSTVTPCRLIQPGGSGSSFLVGQSREIDPDELSRFFVERAKNKNTNASKNKNKNADPVVSTHELCNLFQIAPTQLWGAMLRVPGVASHECESKFETTNERKREREQRTEWWLPVPEEEVLYGQQALVETLCEEDDEFDHDDETNSASTALTLEAMAVKERSLAIARKTVLLASSYRAAATSTNRPSRQWSDVRHRRFRPDASRVAFYVLRDLFLKYPSYAWSDLSERWSSRLPVGERYERITSTTEWIEDAKPGGHGGLVPDQLVFSPVSASAAPEGDGSTNDKNGKGRDDGFGNPKGVLSLVDPRAVLTWRGP